MRRRIRRSLDESRKCEMNKKMQSESKPAMGLTRRRNSLPDMPSIMADAEEVEKDGSVPLLAGGLKHVKKQEEVIALPSIEQNNKIAELNERMLSSNDLQKLNDQNKELNNVRIEFFLMHILIAILIPLPLRIFHHFAEPGRVHRRTKTQARHGVANWRPKCPKNRHPNEGTIESGRN